MRGWGRGRGSSLIRPVAWLARPPLGSALSPVAHLVRRARVRVRVRVRVLGSG